MISSDVSVVIPICNPTKELVHLVYRLSKQTIKPKEIIIINSKEYFDSSELIIEQVEETLEKNQDAHILKIVEIPRREFDHGATRNMGMELATSPYVLMMTQDAVPANRRLIENLLQWFENDDVAICYGRQLPKRKCNEIGRYIRNLNYGEENIVVSVEDIEKKGFMAIFNSDVCSMYDVNKYFEVGGFPAKTIFNEDQIMAYKVLLADYKVVYASDACVFHSHNYSLITEFKRNFDLGVSQKQFSHIYETISSENRGVELVMCTTKHLIKIKKWWLVPKLILSSGAKYMGYVLGKKYKALPDKVVVTCSLNKNYWK